jgi:RNA polymerase sigma-70 factor (ECF subfamily)
MAMMQPDSLVARARGGDAHAQGKLVQLWHKRIYNFAYKFFFDHDSAMEVAQRTFISMHRNLPALQDGARFHSWLYTIAVNCCREELRRQKASRAAPLGRLPTHEEQRYGQAPSAHRHENPERAFRQTELSDLLQQCLLELPDEQREVVIMKEYEGLKFREIAETLNVSENTVKSRMYYALDALRKMLEKKNINRETIGYEL